MANPSLPTYPINGNVVPPRAAYRPEDIVYSGQRVNPQHSFNNMLQGPVHAGSSLPSEQLASQSADLQHMQALRQQFQQDQRAKAPTPMASINPQQQLAFAAANNPGIRMQPGAPGFPSQPGWPMGLHGEHNPGTPGVPGPSGMAIPGLQQGLQNNPSFQNGRPMQPGPVPAAAAAFVFRNNAAHQMNHAQMNSAMNPTAPQATIPQPTQNQPGNPLGDNDAFQMSLPAFPPGVPRYAGVNGTRLSQSPLPGQPFAVGTPAVRPPLQQSTDTSAHQSPSRSANNTPGSGPPPLVDYRDSVMIQMQNSRTQSVPPQPQAVQLQPAPGTHPPPALIPPSHINHPHGAAFRQQQMLMQRQNHAGLGRAQFPSAPGLPGVVPPPPPPASAPPSLLRNASAPTLPTAQIHPSFHPPPPSQTPQIPASQLASSPAHSNTLSSSQPPHSRPASTVAPMELNPSHSPAVSHISHSSHNGSGPMDLAPPPPPVANGPAALNSSTSSQTAFTQNELKVPSPRSADSFSLGMKRVLDFCTAVSKMQKIETTAKTWVSFAHAFLQPTATFEMILWSTTENHSRTFCMDLGMMGRFFHRTFNAGVQSLEITVRSPTEDRADGQLKINMEATWMYKYESGYIVILSGPLEVAFNTEPVENGDWLFSHMAFTNTNYLKTLPVTQVRSMIGAANGQGRPTTSSSSRASPSFTDGSATSTAVEQSNEEECQEFNGVLFPKDPVSHFGVPSLVIPCLDLGEGWSDADMIPMIKITNPDMGPMSYMKSIAQQMIARHPELMDEVQKRDAEFRKRQTPATPSATPQQPPAGTPKNMTNRVPTASPMQEIEPSIPTPSGSRPKPSTKTTRSVAPKPEPPTDTLSDSSLSSPPITSKRKAEEEPEPSLSPTDPAPTSRRKAHASSAGSDVSSSLSTRSTTRQQQRKQSSPKLSASTSSRARRRGT